MLNTHNERFLVQGRYAPFGMGMVGRTWGSEEYRFDFNGKETDDESGLQDYGERIYNKPLGKFLSVDPLTKKYTYLTPYQFASNSPIMAIDLDGLEAWVVTRNWSREDILSFQNFIQTEIEKINAAAVAHEVSKNTCFDCADFALHLIVQYAAEKGLPLEFTDVNGNPINAQDTKFKDVGQFEDKVRGWTNAASLRNNDMVIIEGSPLVGDMTNSGSHINVVRQFEEEYDQGYEDRIPTVSGTIPQCCDEQGNPTETSAKPFGGVLITKDARYTHISQGNEFYRWEELTNVTSSLPTEKVESVKIGQINTTNKEPEIKQR